MASAVHLLSLAEGEPFRLNEGGEVWRRAPNRVGADKAEVARVIGPGDPAPFDARFLPSMFVYPIHPDWRDRSPSHARVAGP